MIDNANFIKQIKQLTGRAPVDIDTMLQSEVVKNEALLEYVAELKQRGYEIGMLSNIASNWIREVLLSQEEQELFDEMIFSYEVGMAKPDARIFLLMCERLRVGTHEAVMIDDVASYCDAAKAEGLAAITFSDLSQLKHELEHLLSFE
jgi:epoxide hydrolase-like predicted phosphatase